MIEDQINTILTSSGELHLDVRHLTKSDVDILGKFSGDAIYFDVLPRLDKLAAEAFLLLDRKKIRIEELFVSEYFESLSLSTILRLSRFVIGKIIVNDIPIDAPEVSLFNEFKGEQFLTRIMPGEINTAKAIAQVEAELISVYSSSLSAEVLDALSNTQAYELQLFAKESISPEAINSLAGFHETLIVSVPNEEAARAYRRLVGYLDVVDKDISMSVANELSQKLCGGIYLSGIEMITPAVKYLMGAALVPVRLPEKPS